ncbi:MAG: methionine--tRNA ligase [Candidatus Aenigmarchaeota archaeon CG_4_10_14_0_8_um_filter_37_24]|nr:MAG: methionine--tRNA ligase [Candidatus Aenigmarchaeota archaeon CG01_land_8_20_14_3_00_37_9]PIW41065.1 MAG: methionine--tRNA ligase [Candidatus Aenigmarchaeota archaeon CG15_BIG_FIL_POST_REV_8_21_14_020_37_27]PIX50914.1 MAG: methionine--tRNA ligase [Candidatus Aenigmarchaeota archaeon CG_4_8_14_3_um_filter_37_24]PIY35766.1 MAG: methionine--tRNA ligase [Candidatus Aenigmarchaeota archaeon CG_4_10_14_3_um_filter_37_21]PIZ35934.1 MAG: methionine--tRNA ligase [Candidatus Aenigmarchaeota archae
MLRTTIINAMKEVSKLNKFYITTAIPYVNAPPHVGHALEFLQTDTVARFQRSLGKDVFFLTGTDENAQKNVLAAEEKGIGVQELVDRNTEFFRKTIDNLGISYDDFIRTTDKKRHWTASQKLWNECLKSGDIYKKTYEGLYCVGCEAFLTEKDLVDGKCPEHLKPPEKIKEENYFFKLSKYQKKLEKLIESDQLKIIPETRKNEILSFIRSGLEDFSVSRPKERMKGWGIPVPNDENQMIYVWFDALINYLSGLGYGSENELFKKYWPADLHVIGKGIIRFHAVYWPAMLLSAGLPLPKSIFVHGYITTEGKKISKSLGNVIDPNDVVKKYGLDSFRYFMLREISPFDDGDFSEKALVERVNNELVANIGNFVYRTLSFMDRYFDGIVPAAKLTKEDKDLIKKIEAYSRIVKELLGKLELKEALQKILELSAHGNKYFQENKPWVLIKENRERCGTVIYTCTHLCRALSILLFPYLPGSCVRLWHQLNLSGRKEGNIWDSACSLSIEPGHKINKPEILFKKIDVNDIEEVEKNTEVKDMIPFKYFKKMEFRVGTVKEAEAVEESDKLIKMRVDFGDFQRQVVAGLTPYYKPEDLSGKQWVFITNLEHAKLMGIESEAMILAAVEGEHEKVVCLKPDKAVKNGTPIS